MPLSAGAAVSGESLQWLSCPHLGGPHCEVGEMPRPEARPHFCFRQIYVYVYARVVTRLYFLALLFAVHTSASGGYMYMYTLAS